VAEGSREATKKLSDYVGIPLATTHVGRYPRPEWYNYDFEDRSPSEVQAHDSTIMERYKDAVKVVLKDQESIGLDIVNDGCLRYDERSAVGEWWFNGFCRIGGLKRWTGKPEGDPVIKSLITPEAWRNVVSYYSNFSHVPPTPDLQGWPQIWYTVEEEISFGKLDALVEFFNLSKPYTSKKMKFSAADVVLGGYPLIDRHYHDDAEVVFALAKQYNRMLTRLASSGCRIIQLDWPLAGLHHVANMMPVKPETWRKLIAAFNEEVKGVDAQIWMHFCFGRIGNSLGLSCTETIKQLAECKADVIQIECANTEGRFLKDELTAWKEHCSDKEVAIGVVSPYNLNSEDPERPAGLIRRALQFVEPERLAITTDEGFRITRPRAEEKLRTLVKAVSMVRTAR